MSPTALAKKLALEFLSQNKNREIQKKALQEYVKARWNSEAKLTTGMLSSGLSDLVLTQKIENPERGIYVLNEQSITTAKELKVAIRQILTKTITDMETLVASINFEPKEEDEPEMTQIYNVITELSKHKLNLMFPPK